MLRDLSATDLGGNCSSLKEACNKILGVVRETLCMGISSPLQRIECEIPSCDLLAILKTQGIEKKFFWSDRNGDMEWLGFGVSIEGTQKALREINVPMFMAMAFDEHVPTQREFKEFPKMLIVAPVVEISQTSVQTKLAVNVRTGDSSFFDEVHSIFQHLCNYVYMTIPNERLALKSRAFVNDFHTWGRQIDAVLDHLNRGMAEKIVLANAQDFFLTESVDPAIIFTRLAKGAHPAFRFFIQTKAGCAFLGASPEQLFLRKGLRLYSEAQAGTRKRGKSLNEDEQLANELLLSTKDYNEHEIVLRDISSKLSGLCCDSGWIDKRTIVRLRHVQHLRSCFGGILNENVSDFEILRVLHPTSAVCGTPSDYAKKAIVEVEKFDRGLYSGAIGLMSEHKTEFAVALRSAVVRDNQIRIFAGAGIVQGSNAADEWNEIESKMGPFYEILLGEC